MQNIVLGIVYYLVIAYKLYEHLRHSSDPVLGFEA